MEDKEEQRAYSILKKTKRHDHKCNPGPELAPGLGKKWLLTTRLLGQLVRFECSLWIR